MGRKKKAAFEKVLQAQREQQQKEEAESDIRMREPVASSSVTTDTQGQPKQRPTVVLLPPKPSAPLLPEQAEQAARRLKERELVEERLAQRAKTLAEWLDKIGLSHQKGAAKVISRWIPADPQMKEVKVDLTFGTKIFYMTPNEAWRTKKPPNFWEVYLHRGVQYMLLM